MQFQDHRSVRRSLWIGLLVSCSYFSTWFAARAADITEVRKGFLGGKYQETIKAARDAVKKDDADEEWHLLLGRSYQTTGKYGEAYHVVTNGLVQFRNSVQMRLLAHEVFRFNNKTNEAKAILDEINQLGGTRLWAYTDAGNLVALGKGALLLGADPKRVLEMFFDRAKQRDPNSREPYLASGEVALDKHDYDLAAKTFGDGLKKFSDDPEMYYGLARAFMPGERKQAMKFAETVQEFNPNHVGSHLLLADHLIDAEEYEAADKVLDKVFEINPSQPEAWAYRSVIATLKANDPGATSARTKGLAHWSSNPEVDYIIGAKLSQKYRFAEGSSHQRRALLLDPGYVPSRSQLASDLLRLGTEDEGWKMAEEASQADAYDVSAYNLVTLKDTMDKFQTITNEHFVVRMSPHEVTVYGDKVLALLERARSNLCSQYAMTPDHPTIVEIFPQQKDFAVRTFGMPGGAGYLGVCFGSVITANSPASQAGHPANWQAVLYHEFCHVVTLQLTKNKMPRWLSEGISVFEERKANPVWGQEMNPKYVQVIKEGGLTPIKDLSSAFMAPKSDMHLQFAYYESSMVVEFLVKNYGVEKLKNILVDLGTGAEINATIEKHTAKMADLEKSFTKFMEGIVEQLAPGMDFNKPKETEWAGGFGAEFNAWKAKNGTNYYALTQDAKNLLETKKYEEAKKPIKILIDLYPNHAGVDNGYLLMAEAHRGLHEVPQEREMLTKLAAIEGDVTDVYLRLMELNSQTNDWRGVEVNAQRYLAVNPLVPSPYRYLGLACEKLEKPEVAIDTYRTLLKLDPPAPADTHFRLGRLLQIKDSKDAKRHVLMALEEAPRYRDAHKLLLKLSDKQEEKPTFK